MVKTPLATLYGIDLTVTDLVLVLSVLQLLREDIREAVDSMELVEPWDER